MMENYENIFIKEDKCKRWHGMYKGVRFEINNFESDFMSRCGMDGWTFYLHIELQKLPKEFINKFWLKGVKSEYESFKTSYKYYGSIFDNMEWNGGVTWYSKEKGFDFDNKVVKVGCDYQHLWDMERGYKYELSDIQHDVKKCINSFLNIVKDYKYFCKGNGNLYSANEGTINDKGYFYSNEFSTEKQKNKIK